MNEANTSGQLGNIPTGVSMADMANPPLTIQTLRQRIVELESLLEHAKQGLAAVAYDQHMVTISVREGVQGDTRPCSPKRWAASVLADIAHRQGDVVGAQIARTAAET